MYRTKDHLMAKTQLDHLRAHLKTGRTISPLEALGLYGMFRLAARVKELRNAGWDITTEVRYDPNHKPYATYKLAEQQSHGLPKFAHAASQVVA
jgi:hypothetical protein